MAYGHMSLFFANAAEAQAYLDGCRRSGNYAAENYQDRVNAQRCIRLAAGWAPAPLPRPDSSKIPLPKKVTSRRKILA
jgi:hypothetical protein